MADIEDLLFALDRYTDRKIEERDAKATADPYSWGYYGSPFSQRREEAAKQVQTALSEIIAAEVTKQLVEAGLVQPKPEPDDV